MKLWIRPVLVAFWISLATTIVLAALGIFSIPINDVPLALATLGFFALFAQIESFVLLRGINPRWRRVRDDLSITIILSVALLFYLVVLAFILPTISGAMSLVEFGILLLLTLALIFSVISVALYFVCSNRDENS